MRRRCSRVLATLTTSALAVALVLGMVGCGGIASVPADNTGGGGGQASADAGPDAEAGADAGWTQCSAPDGLTLCKGPTACSTAASCDCQGADDAGAGVCSQWFAQGNNTRYLDECGTCPDGDICATWYGLDAWTCAPYEAGILYAKNGASYRVRYADRGLWTGDPLPLPTKCPQLGFPVCGGNCGACSSGVCTGRSPLHPYGLCVATSLPGGAPNICGVGSGGSCPSGYGCFTYKVQAAGQSMADEYSFCLPSAYCTSAAAKLPGGGKCSAP